MAARTPSIEISELSPGNDLCWKQQLIGSGSRKHRESLCGCNPFELIKLKRDIGRSAINFSEDAIVAFERDHQIVAIPRLSVATLVAGFWLPAQNQAVFISFIREEVVRVCGEKVRGRCGCIATSAPHFLAWYATGDSHTKIGTEDPVAPLSCP